MSKSGLRIKHFQNQFGNPDLWSIFSCHSFKLNIFSMYFLSSFWICISSIRDRANSWNNVPLMVNWAASQLREKESPKQCNSIRFVTTPLSRATKLWILPMTQNPSSFCFRKSNQVAMTRHPATAWSITVTDYRGHNNFIIGGRRRRFCHLIQFSFNIYYLQNISPGNGIVNISWEKKIPQQGKNIPLGPLRTEWKP